MAETVKQYISRIRGYVGGKDPLRVQAATPGRIRKLVRRLPARRLKRRPAPRKWSIAEILAHLAEAELVGGYRIRMILSKPGTPIQAFDQDVWAKVGRYRELDARKSLEMFCTLRQGNLTLLRSLTPRQWKQYGLHQERGKETVARIAEMFAGHDINHLGQIERLAGGK
ncbi:MAG: DinB family protein [Acidobacteriota bacterium]|nr:DinB family protein [Acidobacteriota bacterium]